MPIQRLSPLVVNQIAAGEVVERPASVVKELLENAINGGATRIEIAVEAGGRELVRVIDNGGGIPFDDLALAVAPHATSKIATADDLTAVATLGFRGEALASIASVSQLSLVSRARGAESGGRIDVAGDEVVPPRPEAAPGGTTVTVRNLFFNTPARRKFLRSDQTEIGRIGQVVESLAMGHPEIGFKLHVNGRTTLDLAPGASRERRILEVLGRELEPELLAVRAAEPAVAIEGLTGRPGIARPTARHQHLFLNGRPIRDRTLVHAIREAYRGLIDPARHPTVALFLTVDPQQVDVNVHPTKAEVRFREQPAVHGSLLRAVKTALLDADLTPGLDPAAGRPHAGESPWQPVREFSAGKPISTDEFVAHFRRLDPVQKGFVYREVRAALDAPEPADAPSARTDGEVLPVIRPVAEVMQVHASYLVTQDEQGLLVIDQHALHERVLFESLRDAIEKGNLESQRLLMPVTLEVEPAQMELLERLQPLLARIAIEAEPIGPTTIGVHAFSSFLFERRVEPAAFMRELLETAAAEGPSDDLEPVLHGILDMMACKAAVKAGDRLSETEMAELIEARARVERSSRCPHGRPTSLRLTIADLDRHFGRR